MVTETETATATATATETVNENEMTFSAIDNQLFTKPLDSEYKYRFVVVTKENPEDTWGDDRWTSRFDLAEARANRLKKSHFAIMILQTARADPAEIKKVTEGLAGTKSDKVYKDLKKRYGLSLTPVQTARGEIAKKWVPTNKGDETPEPTPTPAPVREPGTIDRSNKGSWNKGVKAATTKQETPAPTPEEPTPEPTPTPAPTTQGEPLQITVKIQPVTPQVGPEAVAKQLADALTAAGKTAWYYYKSGEYYLVVEENEGGQ